MPSNLTIGLDEFGVAMDGILEGVKNEIDAGMEKCVRDACRKSLKEVRANAPERKDEEARHYKDGWAYTTRKRTSGAVGEVGNKTKPGLAHLLELGHARIGGGRVNPRPHIKDAADAGADVLMEEMEALAGKAIR